MSPHPPTTLLLLFDWLNQMEILAACGHARKVPVLIDLPDYDALHGRSVSIGSHGYAQIWDYENGVQLLHRWVMREGLVDSRIDMVDHINRQVLDCRRRNLRVVCPTESNLNRHNVSRDLPVGVYKLQSGRFRAVFKRYRARVGVGTFDSVGEAAHALQIAIETVDSRIESVPVGQRAAVLQDIVRRNLTSRSTANVKLTPTLVREIRAEYSAGNVSVMDLARRYGMAHGSISSMLRRKTWRHIV